MNNKQASVPLLVKFNPLRFSHLFLLVAYISLTIGNIAAQGQASILRKIELGFSTGPSLPTTGTRLILHPTTSLDSTGVYTSDLGWTNFMQELKFILFV